MKAFKQQFKAIYFLILIIYVVCLNSEEVKPSKQKGLSKFNKKYKFKLLKESLSNAKEKINKGDIISILFTAYQNDKIVSETKIPINVEINLQNIGNCLTVIITKNMHIGEKTEFICNYKELKSKKNSLSLTFPNKECYRFELEILELIKKSTVKLEKIKDEVKRKKKSKKKNKSKMKNSTKTKNKTKNSKKKSNTNKTLTGKKRKNQKKRKSKKIKEENNLHIKSDL